MKLLATIPAVAFAGHFHDQQNQDAAYEKVQRVASRINWITERRLVPELVSHDEMEGEEVDEEFAGNYRMERPHVNFWLDFSNRRLLSFRQHTNKYQTARNMLSTSDRSFDNAKKYGGDQSEFSDRDNIYNFYKDRHDIYERQTRPTRNSLLRRIASLENMIQYKQNGPDIHHVDKKPFGAYFDYGCHCFPGSFMDPKHSPHAAPVDEIDRACREHSWAYDCAKQDFGTDCRGKYQAYSWEGKIGPDGFTPEIHCVDDKEKNPCSWAICEADKFLAERLRSLIKDYRPEFQVGLSGETQEFDRRSICEVTQIHSGSRGEDHNNDEVMFLNNGSNDATEAPAQSAESPANNGDNSNSAPPNDGLLMSGDFVTDDSMPDEGMPAENSESPSGLGAGRQFTGDETPEASSAASAVNADDIPEYHEGDEVPDFNEINFEERGLWNDKGWPVPEYLLPKPKEEVEYVEVPYGNLNIGNFNPGNNPDFDDGSDLFPQFADVEEAAPTAAAPEYTHAAENQPENIAEHLDTVSEHAEINTQSGSSPNGPFADDANDFELEFLEGGPEEMGEQVQETKAGGSPAGNDSSSEPADEVLAPVLKSAITYSVKQCCGQYPQRYKYSANKMGCCNDNGEEKLYSPHYSKCCVIRTARGALGETYASFLTNKNQDCA